jgi:DNA adenine methylase
MPKTARKYEDQLQLDMPPEEALERFARINTKDVQTEMLARVSNGHKAFPFVKWVGGKRSIIDELVKRLPKKFGMYYEPFVGGGALFFEIAESLTKAVLSDTNLDLVLAYNVIKKDLPQLVALLKKHERNHNEDYYYKIRDRHNLQDPIEIAARLIYLNKTCYNGLWRVNRKGEFNVPIGSYVSPTIVQEKNLGACNKALQSVTILYQEFDHIKPEKEDFVYFDPPYHPTENGSFTKYSKSDFIGKDQQALAEFIKGLHKQGVKIMLSNSDTKFIHELYKGSMFKTEIIHAPRLVNCKPKGRSDVQEVLITNY